MPTFFSIYASIVIVLNTNMINKKIKWLHLDTAGVSYYLTDSKTRFSGATGETFRTLVKYLTDF